MKLVWGEARPAWLDKREYARRIALQALGVEPDGYDCNYRCDCGHEWDAEQEAPCEDFCPNCGNETWVEQCWAIWPEEDQH